MGSDISRQLLSRWVAAGIISPDQAEAIWRLEADKTRDPAPVTAEAPSPGQATSPRQAPSPQAALPEARRIPALAEVLGYAGGSLALGALVALTATYWGRIGTPGRLALSGAVAAICLASGWWLSSNVAPRAKRLGSFVLFIGVAVAGCFVGFAVAGSTTGVEAPLAAAAGAAFICGLAVWWKHRTSLQLIAVTVALVVFVPAAGFMWSYDSHLGASIWGCGYLILGALWCVLAQIGRLMPTETAWALGSLALLSGPQVLALQNHDWAEDSGAYLLLGGAVSLALLAVAVRLGRWPPLALGAAGIVVFTPQILYRWFGDAMGVPIVLLIAGLLLLAMSAVVIRLRTRLHKRTDS
jgi:hypothetical protein